MCSQYAGVQASLILNDVGAVLLELRASYPAKERGKTRPVKTCQGNTNFHEHMLYNNNNNNNIIPKVVMSFYPMRMTFK